MQTSTLWKDYELIDCGDGLKLERWASYILSRPEPQAVWNILDPSLWDKADAKYIRSSSGGGHWEYNRKLPEKWTIHYGELTFNIKPMGFKHTGLFPEQAVNWEWFSEILRSRRDANVLNLFAYTGGATIAAAHAGASVCHVDASKGMTAWAKENLISSGLADRPVRFIVDDCVKFVLREIRRGKAYDGIIMDPPTYGRGPNGEVWKIEDEIYALLKNTVSLLSENPLFMLVNSYTSGLSPTVIANILELTVRRKFGGAVTCDEIGLPCTQGGILLPCGASSRWMG